MPSVTMKFTLPEEDEEYKHARNGSIYHCALHDLWQMFRTERKYGEDRWTEVEQKFWEILKEWELEL